MSLTVNDYRALVEQAYPSEPLPQNFNLEIPARIKKLTDLATFPGEDDIDEAYRLAKKIKTFASQQFELSHVCRAYLQHGSYSSLRKAYEIIQFKVAHRVSTRYLIDSCINTCLRLAKIEALLLASEIIKKHNNPPKFSYHSQSDIIKNALLACEDNEQQNHTIKNVHKFLAERKLSEALIEAKSVEEFLQEFFLTKILDRCCEYGDQESLLFAFDIAINHTQFHDYFLLKLVETCKKQTLKTLAYKFAEYISSVSIRELKLLQIESWEG